MRLPLLAANAIRSRKLILPNQRVLVALSGGPDSVALLHCCIELARKRDLKFSISAAHLNHGLRGKEADADEAFCAALCKRNGIRIIRAFVGTPALAEAIKHSKEETARIARRAFLAAAATAIQADCIAVAHHADDRIETVLYRICRGTGVAGLQGIGWTGPATLDHEPEVLAALQWRDAQDLFAYHNTKAAQKKQDCIIVRPLLGCSRGEVLGYLKSKRQRFCTDETNFDTGIPRNAIRGLVIPTLIEKVHAGARAALWRLAEEAEVHADKRTWRREWLAAFAQASGQNLISLPVARYGLPPQLDELADAIEVLRSMWNLPAGDFTSRHMQALRKLFAPLSGPKTAHLPSGLVAERRQKTVTIRRTLRARELFK